MIVTLRSSSVLGLQKMGRRMAHAHKIRKGQRQQHAGRKSCTTGATQAARLTCPAHAAGKDAGCAGMLASMALSSPNHLALHSWRCSSGRCSESRLQTACSISWLGLLAVVPAGCGARGKAHTLDQRLRTSRHALVNSATATKTVACCASCNPLKKSWPFSQLLCDTTSKPLSRSLGDTTLQSHTGWCSRKQSSCTAD